MAQPGNDGIIDLPKKDTLLMANPFAPEMTVYTDEHIRSNFKTILGECDFEKKYTLHSLAQLISLIHY